MANVLASLWSKRNILTPSTIAPFKSLSTTTVCIATLTEPMCVFQSGEPKCDHLKGYLTYRMIWSYCQIWCMAFRPLSLLIACLPACHR